MENSNPLKYFKNNSFDNKLFQEDQNEALREIFGAEIKGNFLIKVLSNVKNQININSYYPTSSSMKYSIMQNLIVAEFDICKHIIGIHKSNTMFLLEDEINQKIKNDIYCNDLVKQVVDHVKLNRYGSYLFRQNYIISGDRFLYFQIPYKLFVMNNKIKEMLDKNRHIENWNILHKICDMGLSALILMENNLLNETYPSCRGIIELFLTYLIIDIDGYVADEYYKFANMEMIKSQCGQDYSKEFLDLYKNRINQVEDKKTGYLHYGWVDSINNYHKIVYKNPYNIKGVAKYLKNKKEYGFLNFDNLILDYDRCSAFSHANTIQAKYKLIPYFEISRILSVVIPCIYNQLCEKLSIDKKIEDINIIESFNDDFNLFIEQYNDRKTENFENYYKKYKNV